MYKTILILICIFILICIYLSHNINTLEIAQYTIKNKKIPKEFDGYNIVQISDLHSKSFGKNNIKLLQKIKSLNPDIIVITGDLVDGENNNYDIALNFMKELTKLYKVYYIIGNHKVKIQKNNSKINLYGLTVPYSCYKYLFDDKEITTIDSKFLEQKLGDLNKNEFNILLAHTPFYFDAYEKWGADLTLCGHVHGGVVRLPFIGGLLSPDRKFFPKYDLGKYEKNNSTMIVSKGLGGSKVLIRINCKPEIVSIKLKSDII